MTLRAFSFSFARDPHALHRGEEIRGRAHVRSDEADPRSAPGGTLRLTAHTAIIALAAIGTAVSSYLTWVHYSGSLALCAGVGECEVVQTSTYSMLGGIPVALLGFAGMVAMLVVAIARLRYTDPQLDVALFAMALAATVYVAYLTYVELFVLHAVCPWCVIVAVCSISIFAVIAREVMREEPR